jgi:hypothetical protein
MQKPVLSVPLLAFFPDIFPQTAWDLYAPLLINSMAYLQRIPLLSKETSSKFLKLELTCLTSFGHGAAALVVGHNLKVSFHLLLSPYKESFCPSWHDRTGPCKKKLVLFLVIIQLTWHKFCSNEPHV